MNQMFYRELPPLGGFSDIFEESYFHDVPDDWWIVLSDVVGSTKAIEAGRYKDVNSAGTLSAMAISNIIGHMDFPFIFGGDGMTCLVPGEFVPKIKRVLGGVSPIVSLAFELELKQAMLPVAELRAQGAVLKVARWRVSDHYVQGIIEGNGVDVAERILKGPDGPWHILAGTDRDEPDLTGYSCRWQDFPTHKEETIAIMVKFRTRSKPFFKAYLKYIDELFGTIAEHHPLKLQNTRMVFSAQKLQGETAIFTGRKKGFKAFVYLMQTRFLILWTNFFVLFHIPFMAGKKDLSQSRKENIDSSDYKKYDNTLKMVLAVTTAAREKLQRMLEKQRHKKKIFYGLHLSNRAMITCLMQTKTGDEVHFCDAADGGHAYAARQMKEQIKAEKAGAAK